MQRWQQIEELYHSAREHGDGVLAGVDPELRGEVERLLAQDSESGRKLLDQRATDLFSKLSNTQITPGSRLGPYTIEASLGHGGMGHVYRAMDTRLARPVAIKVCKEEFSGRFEQESRSIAAMNHPNVCTLFDVGPNYLVMELVEGETLAARLKRGKLSLSETIRFGGQIADALAVAHGKGIVHRDLKPANIMLTKAGAKVLDFGLAKSTIDPGVTVAGVMGTPAYMAPERLDGKDADARSDIYALGLVLAEMATGRRSNSPDDLPPGLDRVVKRCLEPDPDERWQSARDLKWELESIPRASSPSSPVSRSALLIGALTAAVTLLVAVVLLSFREKPVLPPITRVNVQLPDKSVVRSLSVSPDGRFIAVVLVKDGKQQIWVRSLDAAELTPLAGTENATEPFWSPDSRFIGFFADAKLRKIDRSGGPVQTLCDALAAVGGTWNQNGDILIGALDQALRVSDQGGLPSKLPNHPESRELSPVFLPDGRHYLASPYSGGVWLNSMDGTERRQILPDNSITSIVAPTSGSHIGAVLFTRAGTLMALPFDMIRLKAAGDPFPIAQNIETGPNGTRFVSSSLNGVLAYVSGQQSQRQYVWRDRQGKSLGIVGEAGGVAMISPDGKQVVGDPAGQITTLDFGSRLSTRLTVSSAGMNPAWSPDARYVAYNGLGGIYRKATNGGTPEQLLLSSRTLAVPKSWSPDGRYLIYAQINPGTSADLFALPIGQPDAHPLVLAQTQATEDQGQFSPDGHWVAYTSNESGQSEIYVIPFPLGSNGGRWIVSKGGGVMPRWRRDGKELFYVSPDWKMMAVNINTKPTFQSGTPHALFDTDMIDTGIRTGPMSWDISRDGNRFLIISENSPATSSLNVILNWRVENQK
ncbi:MAG TPA: protein kinase [Terracidiphilus sp.]|nr:protein kinase [Terracidiphilus sp.]